ncbi:MAG: hypothetical protein AAF992_22440 [Bacteroidota bacterium]
MNEPEAVEQTTTAGTNQPTVTPEQTEVEDVETERVVNTKPAITRDSEEYKMMKELRKRNRNNEVLARITVKYGDWDADGDNALNENEFFEGFYRVWDRDNSNSINQDEFTTATENLFVNYEFSEYGQFSDWDTDGNGEVSNQEFMNGMNQIIESDAGQESANRLITIWDLDNDDKIKRIELSNITVLLDADNN